MSESAENGSGDAEVLAKKIIRQVEFYFGDYNLMRDTFMREKIRENEGWFTMAVMLKFKRLSSLCSEPTTILEALKSSKHGLLEVDVENQRIRRRQNREIPQDNEEYRSQLKARTVYVNGFQAEENIDAITDFLSEYGQIEGVSLQRTQDKKFKGSLFATFLKKDEAEKFINAPMVYYKCNELTKMLRSDYYKQQEAEKKTRKRKSEDEKEEPMELKGTVAIKVSGITDDTIVHPDIKGVFESMDIHSIRFFDRFEKLGCDGYLIFQDERPAEEILKILEEKQGGLKVQVKSAEVAFAVPNEEETKRIQKFYIEARQRMFGRGKKHQHQNKQHRKKKNQPHQVGKKTTFDSDEDERKSIKRVPEEDDIPAAKQIKTE